MYKHQLYRGLFILQAMFHASMLLFTTENWDIHTHSIHVWYIYLHLPQKSTIHVGKYIIHGWYGIDTLPRFNIVPEKGPFQEDDHFPY